MSSLLAFTVVIAFTVMIVYLTKAHSILTFSFLSRREINNFRSTKFQIYFSGADHGGFSRYLIAFIKTEVTCLNSVSIFHYFDTNEFSCALILKT